MKLTLWNQHWHALFPMLTVNKEIVWRKAFKVEFTETLLWKKIAHRNLTSPIHLTPWTVSESIFSIFGISFKSYKNVNSQGGIRIEDCLVTVYYVQFASR